MNTVQHQIDLNSKPSGFDQLNLAWFGLNQRDLACMERWRHMFVVLAKSRS